MTTINKATINVLKDNEGDYMVTLDTAPKAGTVAFQLSGKAVDAEGAPDVGYFGDDIEKAKQACQSVVDDYKAAGALLLLQTGGELNAVPAGYELINVIEA